MLKITFLGAGSTMFAQRLLGDCFLTPALRESHIALYDIDPARLRESYRVMASLNETMNKGRARITAHLGVGQRRGALRGARYVINAVQIGGLEAIRNDFEIPKRYGLLQTVGDTLGIGGIFRALRTIPVVLDFARDMADVCPEAWLLNYTNPMAMVTGAVLHGPYPVRCVGLCHSVQGCVRGLLLRLGMIDDVHEEIPITHIANADPGRRLQWTIAGINHQAWLLEARDHGRDLYPEIKRRAFRMNREALRPGAPKHDNMVRFEIMRHFGYYVTESSHHAAEYMSYWLKARFPHLVETFNIPVDSYLKRIAHADELWKRQVAETLSGRHRPKYRSHEYGSYILEAMETDVAVRIHGNVLNRGFIPNLPARAIVEVPCLVDRNGVAGVVVGDLPEICAAINRASINVQLLTIEAALTRKRETVYHAAYVDPHTSSELTLDQIRALCDELFEAHRKWLPRMT
jgi:alpha-galactosidase